MSKKEKQPVFFLSIQDRLILLSVLPAEGSFLTLKIVRELREELSFSEEELKAYNFRQEEKQVFWDARGEQMKEVPMGEKAREIIANAFKELDKQGKLHMEHLPLYEKFVEDE